jgi:steroid delta-isomerase-like uncharacterized protein
MALERDSWARNWSSGQGATPADVAAQYHENAVRRDVNTSLVSEGPKGVTAFAEMFFAAVPDAVCEVRTWLQTGDTLAVEWTWSGTHTGDLEGWPATGKKFTLEGCNITQLRDGLIVDERSYWDWESLRSQA